MRVLVCVAALLASPAWAEEYYFDVVNDSDQRIVTIEVSEDGQSWGYFDIGHGIASGVTQTLVWDQSTNDGDCEWQFRATFEEGYVMASDWIDFCADEVSIVFDYD